MSHGRAPGLKFLVVAVPEELHAEAKAKAAIERTSMRQVIIKALRRYVNHKKAA